jgi:hypothetical protein
MRNGPGGLRQAVRGGEFGVCQLVESAAEADEVPVRGEALEIDRCDPAAKSRARATPLVRAMARARSLIDPEAFMERCCNSSVFIDKYLGLLTSPQELGDL